MNRIAWEIWARPSTGELDLRNETVTPKSGVWVSFSVTQGDGSIDSISGVTDHTGRAQTNFTAGWSATGATIAVEAGGSMESLAFDPPGEAWVYDRSEGTLTATLTSASGTNGVAPGEQRDVTVSVVYQTWDVMVSNLGALRTENHSTSSASGAQISWTTESGDGHVSGYGTTDATGQAQATLTMGSVDTVVRADVSYAAGQATFDTWLFTAAPASPPESLWTYSHSETVPALVNLTVNGPLETASGEQRVVSGMVQLDVWDIWVDGTGAEDRRYSYSSP